MPNHIANRLEIIGTDEQINSVREFLKGEPFEDGKECLIDFNKIIPMPKELNVESGSEGDLGESILLGYNRYGREFYQRNLENFNSLNEDRKNRVIELGKQYLSNIVKYGFRTWYDWAINNWGTKWNAYSIRSENKNIIFFDTAWSNVLNLIKELSLKFPEVEFYYKWADEDCGHNCGEAEVINGESEAFVHINNSDEAWNLYFELHPGSEEEFEKVDGEWKCKED